MEEEKYEEEKRGLKIERYFSDKKKNKPIEYVKSDTQIIDEQNLPLFVQKDVEFPNYFSELSKQIVASRYFYGEHGTDERENSLKQLVDRVTETYAKWAIKQKYFARKEAEIFKDELANLALTQKMAFNSPVWFNVGTDKYKSRKSNEEKIGFIVNDRKRIINEAGNLREVKKGEIIKIPLGEDHLYPQTSACFIQGVKDTMEDIMRLAVSEAILFKYGSGTGTDLSTLRSSRERLSGGGKPSGPLAYLIHYDKLAAIVKSGGKTRRAAKMDSLRVEHPDIKEFIKGKKEEEKKIQALIREGYPGEQAAETVAYQNTNMSVRVTDEFMRAVENDAEWQTIPVHNKELADKMPKYKAKELFRLIAEGTWICGDPGIQYHDIINKWHTCKNSAPINASNPCSEYIFVNDSSCNLASLNLRGFLNEDGSFNIKDFKSAIRTTVIAMDLNYDNSCFPTKEIAQNSHNFRPLGLGYANLGSLIMSLGLPYDSDEARNIAAAITSSMTATVYETSMEMAKTFGTFKEFNKNKEPMIDVIKMYRKASKELSEKVKATEKKVNFNLEEILKEANRTWDYDVKEGEKYGFRNAQATVLAPTGTIGFLMDCDTLGIEPEIGLVQTKRLVEGGTLRRINGTVPLALKKLSYNDEEIDKITKYIAGHRLTEETPHLKKEHYEKFAESKNKKEVLEKLGYSTEQIKEILTYVNGHETIEGCGILKEDHLPVFDCSNKPLWAKRAIHYTGHIKMMAAVQPFLSGAISKTVNMPKEATVEEIENVYKEAWKLGLKAVAIYRDGSKAKQPLSFSDLEEKLAKPIRRKLPIIRQSLTHKFDVVGHEGYLTAGMYDDGKLGELFINMSKEGSTIGGLMDIIGILTSMSLQHGVPLKTLVDKLRSQRFEPAGQVLEGHEELVGTEVKSLVDYIFRFLGIMFLDKEKDKKINESKIAKAELKEANNQVNNIEIQNPYGEELGGFCPCGARLIKKGHCYEICLECGFMDQIGCSG